MSDFTIYTDGACSGNPGPGGWAFKLHHADQIVENSGSALETTNNRMELQAAIQALIAVGGFALPNSKVVIVSDSKYVIQGITDWCKGWVRRGWKNAKGEPVANRDQWEALLKLTMRHSVTWRWVKGHSGDVNNERVDVLACQARDRASAELKMDKAA